MSDRFNDVGVALSAVPIHADLGRYSIGRAVVEAYRNARDKAERSGRPSGLELETSQEIEKRVGVKPRGFYLPLSAPLSSQRSGRGGAEHRTGVDNITTGAGGIATVKRDLIDALRAKSVCTIAGARTLEIAYGLTSLPRKTATHAATWNPEGTPATPGNWTIDAVALGDNSLSCNTAVSRQFMDQAFSTAETLIVDDLMASMAVELDRAALAGTGASNQPLGILYNTGITTYPLGANGAALAWADVCAIEAAVGNANADAATSARMSWITTPNGRSKMRRTEIVSTSGSMIWDRWNTVAGYPALATNQLPSTFAKGSGTNLSSAIYGNFDDLLISTYGAIDVIINPFAYSTSGATKISAFLDGDVNVRHGESFIGIVDFLTT